MAAQDSASVPADVSQEAIVTAAPAAPSSDAAVGFRTEATRALRARRNAADRPGHSELVVPHVSTALERPGRREADRSPDDRSAAAVVALAHPRLARGCGVAVGFGEARLWSPDELAFAALAIYCRGGSAPRAVRIQLRTARARAGAGSFTAHRAQETPERAGEVRAGLRRSRDGHGDRQRRSAGRADGSARASERRARHPAGGTAMGHRSRHGRRSFGGLGRAHRGSTAIAACTRRASRERRRTHRAGVRAVARISNRAAAYRRARSRLGCSRHQRRPSAQQLVAAHAADDCGRDRADGGVAALPAVRAHSSSCVHGSRLDGDDDSRAPGAGRRRVHVAPAVAAGRVRADAGPASRR